MSSSSQDRREQPAADLYRAPAPVRMLLGGLSRLAPPAAVRLATYLFGRPRRGKVRPEEEETLAGARAFRMEVEGRQLACWRWGEGPIVFLHHGWGSRGSRMVPFVVPITSRGFQVITYDAPAHGDSEGRTTTAPDIGRGLVELEEKLGGFHGIIAHSVGCWAAAVGMRRGLGVRRAVFVSPPGDLDYFAVFFTRQMGFTDEVRERMEEVFRERTGVPWDTLQPERMAPPDPPPLLVFHDQEDSVVPEEHARRVVEAWKGAGLVETRGLGHRKILRDPEVVSRAVDFITQGSERAG
ncbi:MAG: alpha/beta hydrolase [bacterium]